MGRDLLFLLLMASHQFRRLSSVWRNRGGTVSIQIPM
jgi:hypothetical protein